MNWQRWDDDPVAEATGVRFNREEVREIKAPTGKVRVCAFHIDFDERPVIYADVDSAEEAQKICDGLSDLSGDWNVDFAIAYDSAGQRVARGPW